MLRQEPQINLNGHPQKENIEKGNLLRRRVLVEEGVKMTSKTKKINK